MNALDSTAPRLSRRDVLRHLACGASALAWPVVAGAPAWARRATPSVATTTAGRVRGEESQGIHVFKGVPYGANTSAYRFQPPRPPQPWPGVRDAIDPGPFAPQVVRGPAGALSEDCLRLHVWTPGLRDRRTRPVLVYFHGGGYSAGSANYEQTDGTRLARRGDVVVVAVNHRLNAFGYLYLGELGGEEFADSGNVGQLDLVQALAWVRDNIAEFGGDPANVTIFGQSGGGAKCATLMAMPAAHGLFHRVITMSGQQVTAIRPAAATMNARRVLEALQIAPGRAQDLRAIPMEVLIKVSRAATYLGPVMDGRSLPRDPFSPDAPPLSAGVPMILGNTHDETRNLLGRADPTLFDITWDALPAKLEAQSAQMTGLDRHAVIAEYRRLYPRYSAADVFFAATTAARTWRAQVIEAERRAVQPVASGHTWVYQLDWGASVDGGKWRARHGLDIPLAFDNVALSADMVGDSREQRRDAQRLADVMADVWIAFARTGRPVTRTLPEWPTYDLTRRATMVFDTTSRVVDDPRGAERRLFASVPYAGPGM